MPEANRKQALCIDGGELLPNPNGTAPGQYVCHNGVHYFLLPGPPLEMEPMLKNEVVPRVKVSFSGGTVLVSRVLHFCGIGESDVDAQIVDLTRRDNPTVAPLAGEGEMLLRVTATGADAVEAQSFIQPVEERLAQQFEPYLYGYDDDTLPSVVQDVFLKSGRTLAVAESCTGGLIASMLTGVPGSSGYLQGGVVAYSNQLKVHLLEVAEATLAAHGAVSEEAAREMAQGVRRVCVADYGLSVTGIAGPGGGTPEKPVGLVYGAIASSGHCEVYKLQFRGSREQIRLRAAKALLWRLWSTVK